MGLKAREGRASLLLPPGAGNPSYATDFPIAEPHVRHILKQESSFSVVIRDDINASLLL